jgi:ADP-ribose pyrophosphatase
MPKRLKKISEETIHSNSWWAYKHDVFEKADGSKGDYYYSETNGASIIIPVLSDGRIVMIIQHRYLEDKQSIEFPAGGIDKGSDANETAKQELLEETGWMVDNLIKIGTFQPAPGFVRNQMHVFVAEVSEQREQQLEDTEDIEVIYRRPDEIDDMIKNHDIFDGVTLATWAMVRNNFFKNSTYDQ